MNTLSEVRNVSFIVSRLYACFLVPTDAAALIYFVF